MTTRYLNTRIIDPTSPWHNQQVHITVGDGRIIAIEPAVSTIENNTTTATPNSPVALTPEARHSVSTSIDMSGTLVMAGGIDLHTHIGGGKVNLARLLLQESLGRSSARERGPLWSSKVTGAKYAMMGYTACFEPAMLLPQARSTHLQLADTPWIDSGAYVVMGNEDWLLRAIGKGIEQSRVDELVAWNVRAARALAVKVVNAGGISAFQFNQRSLDVDQAHAYYGATPRAVISTLAAAVDNIGLPHPLHVHASNLGMPGNIAATLATLDAAGGRRLHLTHAQFNAYSIDGPMGMGSGALSLAERINRSPELSIDVGQIVFGHTVTISADAQAQYRNSRHAHPAKSIISDIECVGGCGVVPMRYESGHYVSSLQWTIGLELLLLIKNPYQVLLTTDHPNGGPFTCYPHLIRLLMDRAYRDAAIASLHPLAAERTLLKDLDRVYTLEEIAILTRAAPARLLGLHDRGSVQLGMRADLSFYAFPGELSQINHAQLDWQSVFTTARVVTKAGYEIVRDGQPIASEHAVPTETIMAIGSIDSGSSKSGLGKSGLDATWRDSIEQTLSMPLSCLEISDDEFAERMMTGGRAALSVAQGGEA